MAAISTETLKLKYPIETIEPNVIELTMRRPKVKDHIAAGNMKGSELEQENLLMSTLCDTSLKVIQELDMIDYDALVGIYSKMVPQKKD